MKLGTELVGKVTDPQAQYAIRQEVGRLYEEATTRSLPEGGTDAIDLLAYADALENASSLVSPVVADALGEVSDNARTYINAPNAYFERVDGCS